MIETPQKLLRCFRFVIKNNGVLFKHKTEKHSVFDLYYDSGSVSGSTRENRRQNAVCSPSGGSFNSVTLPS